MNNGPSTPKGSPALDAEIAAATTPEQVREAIHRFYNLSDAVDYRQENFPAPDSARQAASLSAPAQQGNPTHERVCYPSGNDRYILTGFSDEELDRKEAAIKAALGVQ